MTKVQKAPRGDAVIEKLLEGGLDVFLKRGFEGTSVDAVSQETKTSKATIYRHFSSKDDLFRAVVKHAISTGRQPIKIDVNARPDIAMVLQDFALRWIDRITVPRQLALCRTFVSEVGRFPDIEQLFSVTDDQDSLWLNEAFERVLAKAGAEEMSARDAAHLFNSMVIMPMFLNHLFRPSRKIEKVERKAFLSHRISQFLQLCNSTAQCQKGPIAQPEETA